MNCGQIVLDYINNFLFLYPNKFLKNSNENKSIIKYEFTKGPISRRNAKVCETISTFIKQIESRLWKGDKESIY